MKLAGSKPEPAPAPAETTPVDDTPPADAGLEPQPSTDDKPFDDEPFDAGVEADEESDPKKFIEQLTGKLGQSLRKYNEEQGQPDFELEKFAINSLLSATHTSEMDEEDKDDIIKKVKEAGKNDSEDSQDTEVDANNDTTDSPDLGVDGGSDGSDTGMDSGSGEVNEEMTNLFVNPKKNNMFQPGSNDKLNESCWKGYKQIGMKEKNGKQVPNCVPVNENNTGSVIDFEGVTDNLVNMLVSGEFSENSRDKVYLLAKKTLEGRSAAEKIKLYKLLAIKIGNYTKAFKEASSEQSSYYMIASRLEGLNENENIGESNNYMFWSNLKTIVHATGELLEMDQAKVDDIIANGHAWAVDHISTSNDDIEEVYHFLEGQINYEGADETPMTENESNNYMFWQNLKTMHHGAKEMLAMDPSKIDQILSDGHGWALDHVATSTDDVEEVYHFLETEVDSYDGGTEGGYKDEYGTVENVNLNEAEYQGKTVTLGKPSAGDVKKFKVYVKNEKGNVVKVNFGDPNMEIKRDNPERRKSFRARHKCSQAKDRTTPKYWSCKMWSKTPVSKMVSEDLNMSGKNSIFDKNYIKMKIYESFNQESEPMIEPQVKPAPVTKPSPNEVQPNIAPSRKNKPFLPMPEVKPDPKAKE